MALSFTAHEDVVYERAPLTVVVCQVKFPPIMSLLAAAGVAGFQAALRDEYPVLMPGQIRSTVSITPGSMGMEQSAPTWKLVDETAAWTVALTVDSILLETPSYTDIGEFLARFDRIMSALRRTVRPADSLRIGLRKVNEIELGETIDRASLLSSIRPELLGVLSAHKLPSPVSFNFSQVHFAEDDNTLAVQYGLHPGNGHGTERVSKFVLDLDYFTERPYAVDGTDELLRLIRHFSDGMTSFFQWALTPEYKNSLGPRFKTPEENRA